MEEISAKHILQRKKDKSWFGTDYNFNIYQGCPHGCLYCDSRSECYRIEDFDRVRVKKDVIELLHQELRSCRKPGLAATGSMSDPYNPFEKKYEYTRQALKLLCRYGFGASIATKSCLVERDIDILTEIAKSSPVVVKITVTTPRDELAAVLEPHAPPSSQRLKTLKKLSDAGLFAGVLLMPVMPFLEDDPADIVELVRLCSENGAKFIYPYFGVTLRDRQREYFLSRIRQYSEKVWLNYLEFGEDYQCLCQNHRLLWKLFCGECDKLGISYTMKDITERSLRGYQTEQMSLF